MYQKTFSSCFIFINSIINHIFFRDLPADILSELSMILNPPLIGKDYKYLAGKMGKSFQIVRWLEMQRDPTASLLEHWWSGCCFI